MCLDNMSEEMENMDILEMGNKVYIIGMKDHKNSYVGFSSDW